MNIQNYLTNPMGKGTSVLMLSSARRALDEQYLQLHSKMSVRWYVVDDKFCVAHVKVPSKSKERLWYDVLLEFDIDTMRDTSTSTINNANVRVFSNCPSFAYSYANVFNHNKDLIDWARIKYPKEIITKQPEVRNPYKIVSYERSLYFAIRYVLSNGRNYKAKINNNTLRTKGYIQILQQVKSLNEIMELYNSRKKINDTRNNKTKDDKKDDSISLKDKNLKKHAKNAVKTTSKTRVTKTVSKVKKSKKTNKI